jgi:hypothetical protein
MLFARAISNAVRMYAPDVFNGNLVYDPDELGAPIDATGEVVVEQSNSDVDKALEAINEAPDEDVLNEIVFNLPNDIGKLQSINKAASLRFKELNKNVKSDS